MRVKDVVSWNTILSGLHNAKDPHGVHQLLLQMRRDGFGPNEYTISIVLRAFLGTVLNVLVSQIHAFAIILALNSSVFVGSALMKGYANIGDRVAMASVFDEISAKDVSSWNALISSYVELGCLDEAQRVFDGMLERNVVSWTSLVNGYIRNRRVDKARSVFDKMSGKNVVSWTVMISGYVKNQRCFGTCPLDVEIRDSAQSVHIFKCAGCKCWLFFTYFRSASSLEHLKDWHTGGCDLVNVSC